MPAKKKVRSRASPPLDPEGPETTPPVINPYQVLGIEPCASADDIKTAYRKAALKHHPDKVPPDRKIEAHAKFQEIAFAYALLSDARRRERYDATGSTADSLSVDEDFCWSDFFRAQFKDVITQSSITQFSRSYKGSDEEMNDILAAYTLYQGKWDKIFESVMLSDPLEDEDRIRAIINEAIRLDKVKAYKAFTHESAAARKRRLLKWQKERDELASMAEAAHAEDLLKTAPDGGENTLKALIQKNQMNRSVHLDELAAKYAAREKSVAETKSKKAKKRAAETEPSEEEFLAARAKLESGDSGRRSKRTKR
ncbi:unnamed protein product [Blumeria hordei]|uniref:J domain-containing protein n=2 Tax=Blumeria hordei TaxID=2867405 RepID=A0A383UKL5_BLUHO|nr:DnaJ domain-containing protein [Blumeria hordei DH14]SZF00813.1 unnamed protein product [Blumeria hordei]